MYKVTHNFCMLTGQMAIVRWVVLLPRAVVTAHADLIPDTEMHSASTTRRRTMRDMRTVDGEALASDEKSFLEDEAKVNIARRKVPNQVGQVQVEVGLEGEIVKERKRRSSSSSSKPLPEKKDVRKKEVRKKELRKKEVLRLHQAQIEVEKFGSGQDGGETALEALQEQEDSSETAGKNTGVKSTARSAVGGLVAVVLILVLLLALTVGLLVYVLMFVMFFVAKRK